MVFSLRTLLIVVLVAAIFAAALAYHTELWATVAINLALGILIFGTLGVWIGGLQRRFWIPFCFVGWLYLALSFTSTSILRVVHYLPSTQLWHAAITPEYEEAIKALGPDADVESSDGSINWLAYPSSAEMDLAQAELEAVQSFRSLANTLHAVFAVIFACVAGIVAAVVLRRQTEAPTKPAR